MWPSSISRWPATAAWTGSGRSASAALSSSIVVLSVHDEDTVRQAALAAGADAVVLKRAIATDLLPAIMRAGAGFRETA